MTNLKMAFNLSGKVEQGIMVFVLLIVMFKLFSSLIPEGITAGNELNATAGFSFGSFFASGGITWTILSISLLVLVIKSVKIGGK